MVREVVERWEAAVGSGEVGEEEAEKGREGVELVKRVLERSM